MSRWLSASWGIGLRIPSGSYSVLGVPSGIGSSRTLYPGSSFLFFWVLSIFFCCLDISGSHFSMVLCPDVFCDIFFQAFLFLFPEYVEMIFSDSVSDSIKYLVYYLICFAFGPDSKVPTLTHYGMVWFQNRALAKATSRLWPYLG